MNRWRKLGLQPATIGHPLLHDFPQPRGEWQLAAPGLHHIDGPLHLLRSGGSRVHLPSPGANLFRQYVEGLEGRPTLPLLLHLPVSGSLGLGLGLGSGAPALFRRHLEPNLAPKL